MHATQPQGGACPEPTRRFDGKPETDADHRFFDLREAAFTGPIDQNGYGVGTCEDCGLADTPLQVVKDADTQVPHIICVDVIACDHRRRSSTATLVLRSAALYLERHGWIQGSYYDTTSQVFTPAACLVGAIGMVCYGGPVDAPAQHFDDPGYLDFEEALLHLDRYLLVEDGSESYEFNDANGRRVEDVLHVLREAASRPAEELIDAIRAVEPASPDMADLKGLFLPSGAFRAEDDEQWPVGHIARRHLPGNLFGCPTCEERCFCAELSWRCVHCARTAERSTGVGATDGDVE
jgi:hypothetical protein